MSLEYAGYQWSSNGAPVKVIYPADGTIAQMEGVAIIKGGPNTENAKLFVDYVSRKDVREAILRFAFRRPARQDLDLSKLPGAMPQLSDVKLIDYDEDAWVEKRAETAKKIQDIIRAHALIFNRPGDCLTAITIDGVARTFGTVRAVDDVSIAVRDGEFFTLLGPSGCGKTTLLRMVAGFCELDTGRILFGDERIDTLPPHKRNTGMVFQNYAVFPNLTVGDNVAYGLRARKVARRRRSARASRAR